MAHREALCHVIIVGAGLGGLAAAIGIKKAGYEVTVLEKMSVLREVRTIVTLYFKYFIKESLSRLGPASRFHQTRRGSSSNGEYWKTSSGVQYSQTRLSYVPIGMGIYYHARSLLELCRTPTKFHN